jgi:ketosteroid isomerase-like protein
MSSEAAALVQHFNDRWNHRDLDGVQACIDDAMEFDWSHSIGPLRGVYRGHEGMGQGRGKGSGADVEAAGAMSWVVRGGKIVAGRFFQTREEALKAASSERPTDGRTERRG